MSELTAEEMIEALRNIDADIDNAVLYEEYVFSSAADLIESLQAELKQLKFDDEEFAKLAKQNGSTVFTPEELLSELIKAKDNNIYLQSIIKEFEDEQADSNSKLNYICEELTKVSAENRILKGIGTKADYRKGCKYCTGKEQISVNGDFCYIGDCFIDTKKTTASIAYCFSDKQYIIFIQNTDSGEEEQEFKIPIRNCPNCGRKLKEVEEND